MFELVSFIEYVGRLPSKNSTRIRAHYIGYRCIHHTWIQNDDEWCHIMDVNGDYKINMAFYRRMASQTVDEFEIEEEGILRWRKSVVIRGVYKSPPKGRGRGRGRGRDCRGRGRGSSAVNSSEKGSTKPNNDDAPDEENDQDNDNDENTASTAEKDLTKDDFLIYGDLSSEDESSNESGKKCLFKLISHWSLLLKSPVEVSYWSLLLKILYFGKNVDFNKNCIELSENILEYMPNLPSVTPSTQTSYYETRTASRTRQSLGSDTRHLALDNKGAPFVINPACKTIFTQIDITWNCWRQLWIILIAFQTIYAVIRGRPRGWLRGRRGCSLCLSATPAKISTNISPSSSEKGYVYCYCFSWKCFHIS